MEEWLDDTLLHSKTMREHFVPIFKVLNLLVEAGHFYKCEFCFKVLNLPVESGYSVHFYKCEFCLSEVGFLGVMVGREGSFF